MEECAHYPETTCDEQIREPFSDKQTHSHPFFSIALHAARPPHSDGPQTMLSYPIISHLPSNTPSDSSLFGFLYSIWRSLSPSTLTIRPQPHPSHSNPILRHMRRRAARLGGTQMATTASRVFPLAIRHRTYPARASQRYRGAKSMTVKGPSVDGSRKAD